jgi:hypothetical protein
MEAGNSVFNRDQQLAYKDKMLLHSSSAQAGLFSSGRKHRLWRGICDHASAG